MAKPRNGTLRNGLKSYTKEFFIKARFVASKFDEVLHVDIHVQPFLKVPSFI